MSKEEQPLRELVRTLDAQNIACERSLCMSFKDWGSPRTLLFPTPLGIQEAGTTIAHEFLVLTPQHFEAIYVDRIEGQLSAQAISDIITPWIGRKKPWLSPIYRHGGSWLKLDGSVDIDRSGTQDWRGTDFMHGKPRIYNNCRLVDVSAATAEQIIYLNTERVRNLHTTIQSMTEKADSMHPMSDVVQPYYREEPESDHPFRNLLGRLGGAIAPSAGLLVMVAAAYAAGEHGIPALRDAVPEYTHNLLPLASTGLAVVTGFAVSRLMHRVVVPNLRSSS